MVTQEILHMLIIKRIFDFVQIFFLLYEQLNHDKIKESSERNFLLMNLSLLDLIEPIYTVISYFLLAYGMSMLFAKCGMNRKWAYVPVIRIFKLAHCIRMEDSGYVWMFSYIVVRGIYILMQIKPDIINSILVSGIILAMAVTMVVYEVRIYIGVCDLFKKSKLWAILWIISFGWVPAIIWGRDPSTQPHYFHSVAEVQEPDAAAPISGYTAEATNVGLSVNLESRTARELFKKKTLLRDIHMNIKPGRMVLLLGGSGAGKTTLVNAIIGYEKADASILLNGGDVYKDYDKIKYDVAMVPQQDLIRYDDTVLRTLRDAATLRLPESVSRQELVKRVDEVLDIFGLATVRNSEVEKLSGGQKKRLSIAMEFISDPALFVLDEPDSGLDGVLAKDLMRRLWEISRKGKTIIVITHSPDRVIEYFDDVIVLAKDAAGTGRLVFYGPLEVAGTFFGTTDMEHVVKMVNRIDEGGEGRADELIEKYAEVRSNGTL